MLSELKLSVLDNADIIAVSRSEIRLRDRNTGHDVQYALRVDALIGVKLDVEINGDRWLHNVTVEHECWDLVQKFWSRAIARKQDDDDAARKATTHVVRNAAAKIFA